MKLMSLLPGSLKPGSFRRNARVLSVVLAVWFSVGSLSLANPYLTLHSFTGTPDGATPNALIQSGATIYGTTMSGGTNSNGTIFKINTDGTGYTILYCFSQADIIASTNSDGAQPSGALLLSAGSLYGTTQTYGPLGGGTVFSMNTNGSNFTVLHPFSTTAGGNSPAGSLLLSGNTLYGTTSSGIGAAYYGTIFKVNTGGTSFSNLYDFSGGSDGGSPTAPLVLSGTNLYGTTTLGGSAYGANGSGTLFKLNPDSLIFGTLHTFSDSDGANPYAALILSGTNLYGTTAHGGSLGWGTVFAINTDGSGFTNLYSFKNLDDGSTPAASLALFGSALYGTTGSSGTLHPGGGTIFRLNTNGSAFTTLYILTNTQNDGKGPGPLLLSGSTMYGTTGQGGTGANGVAFALTTQLTVQNDGAFIVLSWGDPSFTLQAAPFPQGPFTNVPATSPFTNPTAAPALFFRLIH